MFQYACGRALAYLHNTELTFEISQLNGGKRASEATLRSFELDVFNLQGRIANRIDLNRVKPLYLRIANVIAIKSGAKGLQLPHYFIEKGFSYNSAVKKINQNCYLAGYWQSPKYFQGIEPLIREEFSFRQITDKLNENRAKIIAGNNSIGLHVRRTDFVNNKFHDIHGTCSVDYYKAAVDHLVNKVNDPFFFIFSDDMGWIQANLDLKYPYEVITGNRGKSSFIDMQLMSMCKHNIIANSSFSWWGAWLNLNRDKIVIAPRKWFTDEKLNLQTKDLIPESWMRL